MATSIAPLTRPAPMVERVYRRLRRAAIEGAFAPDARLVEAELGRSLGVSRTPVREALARLQAEGLVVALPGGGLVARDARSELAEVYRLRSVLEGHAARLAAERASDEELAAIAGAQRDALAALDAAPVPERVRLNNEFHARITAAAHSPRLAALIDGYRDYFLDERSLRLFRRDVALRHHEQHAAIVRALRAGDGDAAERLVREHFASAMDIVLGADGEDPPWASED